jgi:ABC-type uncharacterized transport system involved in gliding motility auxiliary subunit
VEYIDADKKPVETKQHNVDAYGTVVIEYKGRTERVSSSDEQELTNGLVKVLTGEKKKVYFVQGHGEKDIDSSDRTGYSGVKSALERDNYEIAKTVLAQEKDVPADASVVVIAGPKTDLLQPEADMLERFLKKGGHVLVLTDPPGETDPPTPVTDALLRDWDFQAGKDVVVDASGMGQLIGTDASVPVVAQYPSHPITDRFNVITAYPLARSITPILPASNGRAAVTIIQTSPRSWAEADMAQLKSGKVELNPDKGDKPGPVSIGAVTATTAVDVPKPDPAKAAAADQRPPESRFVTIGDSDFAANYALPIQGNSDLFVNTINWLAQQENLISIRPKPASESRLTITAQQATAVLWMSLLVIPAIVFGTGVYAWWRKR